MSDPGESTSVQGAKYDARWLYAPTGRKGIAQGKAKRRPGIRYATKVASPERAEQAAKSVPGTRCVARSDASKQAAQIGARHPVRRRVKC